MQVIAILISHRYNRFDNIFIQTTWQPKQRLKLSPINASFYEEHGRASDFMILSLSKSTLAGAINPGKRSTMINKGIQDNHDQTSPSSSNTKNSTSPSSRPS